MLACVSSIDLSAPWLRQRCHGVIEIQNGRLHALRPLRFARRANLLDHWWGLWRHRHGTPCDRVRCIFHHPRSAPRYLALAYVVSWPRTRLASFRLALRILDEIARLRQVDAIVCDVANARISHRLLTRWGWEPHAPQRWHRNYIKRFYGNFPPPMEGAPMVET
jgi:hypothetical protein